jgi:hypothetical protein
VRRENKYIAILSGFLVLVVVVQLLAPKPLDWTPTYLATDKNPFGAFVARSLFGPFFVDSKIVTDNLTFYELQDSIKAGENIISLSDRFNPDDESAKTLFNKVDSGSCAFISAYSFSGKFADTLKLYTTDVYFGGLAKPGGGTNDTTDLKFVLPGAVKKGYYYKLENVSFFFTTLDSLKATAFVVSTNAWNKPVTLRIPWGKGQFIINTTPLAFTNNYLLYETNHSYAEQTLSLLPATKTWWSSYYQLGRLEAQTPLRFILNNESLRWAYYMVVTGWILFILFESKRKQRAIPILLPLANTTLEFVKTIGNMYLQANDHKAIAEKKIAFFLDRVRSNYYLSLETGDAFVEKLAKKSGNSLEKTQQLFGLIRLIQNSALISEKMLLDLNEQMDQNYKNLQN